MLKSLKKHFLSRKTKKNIHSLENKLNPLNHIDLSSLAISANELVDEMTTFNAKVQDLNGVESIQEEYTLNKETVIEGLKQRGIILYFKSIS